MLFVFSCALALVSPDIVELDDGSRLVGRVLPTGPEAAVVVLSAGGRVEVSRDRVQAVQTHRQLLARYRTLEKSGDALHCMLGRSLWCLDHGLWEEALTELDAAMLAAPESKAWESVLERAAARVCLDDLVPETLTTRKDVLTALQYAGGRRPARAAVAARWLREGPDAETGRQLEALCKSARIELRRAAMTAIVQRNDPESLSTLILRSLEEKDKGLREIARQAVLRQDHPDLVVPFVHALRSPKASVRINALPVLESLQDPRAIAPLISLLAPRQSSSSSAPRAHIFVGNQITYVRDFEVEIAQGAVIAKPVIGVIQEGSLLDVRVASAGFGGSAGRGSVIGSLERLSGRRFGDDYPSWREWWMHEGKKVLAKFKRSREQASDAASEPQEDQAKQMQ